MKDFRDLKVWEKAHAVALSCYQATFLNSPDYDRLQAQVTEVKRMLASLVRKVDSERL
jgi:hypothetical protein